MASPGEVAYGVALALVAIAAILVLMIGRVPQTATMRRRRRRSARCSPASPSSARRRSCWAPISLDLFAVLLGGAVALLPVYARDILEVGPWGLGLLRAAPGVGAVDDGALPRALRHQGPGRASSCSSSWRPFGFFTMVFGLSTSVPLSIAALVLMGACDMVSVYIRETLLQLWTPDEVRGRVNAVNRVFIGASNELGEFRAGVGGGLIGAVAAVALGGAGTMAVAFFWSRWFPELRTARRLDGRG